MMLNIDFVIRLLVAGILGAIIGLDVSLVRIIYVFATIFTAFAGTLIYIILLVIIPEEPNRYYQHD
jgi:phage shock protein PspC (stress-responsive transcriptional regulator)